MFNRQRRFVSLLCAAALAVCCLFALPAPQSLAEEALPPAVAAGPEGMLLETPEIYAIGWFREGNTRYADEPWLDITTSVEIDTESSSEVLWWYKVYFSETAGHTFTPDRVDEYIFWSNIDYHLESVPREGLNYEEGGQDWLYIGCMPEQDILCSGFLIYGHDEAGNPMSFRTYVDFPEASNE